MYGKDPITVGELKRLLDSISNDTPVKYKDPNFSGAYYALPDLGDFSFEDGALLINFPFESPVS